MKTLILVGLLFIISLTSCSKQRLNRESLMSAWNSGYNAGIRDNGRDRRTYIEFDNIPLPSCIKDTSIMYNKGDSLNGWEYNILVVYDGDKMSLKIKRWNF